MLAVDHLHIPHQAKNHAVLAGNIEAVKDRFRGSGAWMMAFSFSRHDVKTFCIDLVSKMLYRGLQVFTLISSSKIHAAVDKDGC